MDKIDSRIKFILGVITAITISVVGITSYLDNRAAQNFYQKSKGEVLEEKIRAIEKNSDRMDVKLDQIQQSQQIILIELGKLQSK